MSNLLKIKIENTNIFIVANNILYIEAFNKHSIIHCNDLKKIEVKHPLKWFESQLSEPSFFRSHISFIVNCHYFESINNLKVILQGGIYVPISRNKKQLFEINLENYYNQIEALPFTPK